MNHVGCADNQAAGTSRSQKSPRKRGKRVRDAIKHDAIKLIE
jgi:hypothetical protein